MSCLAHHFRFSLASSGIRAWLHDGKGNPPTSFCLRLRREVAPLALAMGNATFPAVALSEDRARSEGDIHDWFTFPAVSRASSEDADQAARHLFDAETAVTVCTSVDVSWPWLGGSRLRLRKTGGWSYVLGKAKTFPPLACHLLTAWLPVFGLAPYADYA